MQAPNLHAVVDESRSFLNTFNLPLAWKDRPHWCVLDAGIDGDARFLFDFLVVWQAWKQDLNRPKLLHFVAPMGHTSQAVSVVQNAPIPPDLIPFAAGLRKQLWGLEAGLHRLVFEDGRVLLTLYVGGLKSLLEAQDFFADAMYLTVGQDAKNYGYSSVLYLCKAIGRCSRRGARLAWRGIPSHWMRELKTSGFVSEKNLSVTLQTQPFVMVFDPPWKPSKTILEHDFATNNALRCVVVGAGLAGAACAASLARRGWQVTVVDAAEKPAGGASGVPVGLFAPHVSSDDCVFSQLSRSGVRATLQQAQSILVEGQDWQATGVLQIRFKTLSSSPNGRTGARLGLEPVSQLGADRADRWCSAWKDRYTHGVNCLAQGSGLDQASGYGRGAVASKKYSSSYQSAGCAH